VVLLSHLHADHADAPSIRRLGRSIEIIAPSAATGWLRRRGFTRVRQVAPGDELDLGPLTVAVTPAEHDGRRLPHGSPADAVGFVVRGMQSAYFAGDTDLFPEMAAIAGVDVALLPVAGWGPSLGPGHLDPGRAAEAAAIIRPRIAVPIHWGTFAPVWLRPAAEARAQPAEAFAAAAAKRSPTVAVRVLEPGGSLVVRASGDDGCTRGRAAARPTR
jgi:L-ascorbate metabolism protein UlaG (beta-lactamase superfamily)